ncbi:MarR family winged helix-turn-helix transcriptional regulator [Gordonia sp. NPDC003424]
MSEESVRSLTAAQQAVWLDVVDGGWALLAAINAELSRRGLAQTDLRVLEALSGARERGISELASDVHMSVSTVSRQVGRLTESGAVERISSDVDGRHRLVRVTEAGHRLTREHVMARDELIRKFVVDVLTDEEYDVIGAAFRKIGEGLSTRRG